MFLDGFTLGEDLITVIKDGVVIDLHNDFDLSEYKYIVYKKHFKIKFVKSSGEWVTPNAFGEISFVFKNVDFIKIKEADSLNYPDDEKCLTIIGLSSFDMRQDMDSVLDLKSIIKIPDNFDLLFGFQQGQSIRIHSEVVFLETK
jgi:hypothetical protein